MPTPDFRARRNISIGFVLTTHKAIRPIPIWRVPRLFAEYIKLKLAYLDAKALHRGARELLGISERPA
jgi:hypothetical protein